MKRRASLIALAWLFSAIFFAATAQARLIGENLLFEMPEDYKIALEERNATVWLREMVPSGQSAEDWASKITVKVLYTSSGVAPVTYMQQARDKLLETCPAAEAQPIRDGRERGYRYAYWLLYCESGTQAGPPRYAYYKAIQGREALYVIERIFKSRPERWRIPLVSRLLFDVHLCDNRVSYQICPNGQ